mmetsp:Transcript_96746/g.230254  ORF Transcript_96746/g.230254 Transcript_96746/m.230254 type:complete len:349 (+) Transcript_96746:332-1378(+)
MANVDRRLHHLPGSHRCQCVAAAADLRRLLAVKAKCHPGVCSHRARFLFRRCHGEGNFLAHGSWCTLLGNLRRGSRGVSLHHGQLQAGWLLGWPDDKYLANVHRLSRAHPLLEHRRLRLRRDQRAPQPVGRFPHPRSAFTSTGELHLAILRLDHLALRGCGSRWLRSRWNGHGKQKGRLERPHWPLRLPKWRGEVCELELGGGLQCHHFACGACLPCAVPLLGRDAGGIAWHARRGAEARIQGPGHAYTPPLPSGPLYLAGLHLALLRCVVGRRCGYCWPGHCVHPARDLLRGDPVAAGHEGSRLRVGSELRLHGCRCAWGHHRPLLWHPRGGLVAEMRRVYMRPLKA